MVQTLHKVPTPPEEPPTSTFDPSPVYWDTQGCEFPEVCDPLDGADVQDCVRHISISPLKVYSYRGYLSQSDPLHAWSFECDKFLQELMLLEGRMGFNGGECYLCSNPDTVCCSVPIGLYLQPSG